jgi:HlyD family secretion protein
MCQNLLISALDAGTRHFWHTSLAKGIDIRKKIKTDKDMNKKKLIIGIVGVLVVAGGIWFFTGKTSKGGIRLETAKVGRSSISNTVTGTVEPVTEVEVGTQVSGIIDKLYADYNDVVKAGQLIAEMDKVNLKAELASAEAQLASSKSEFEYQQKNYARNKILFEKKLISDSDYETSTYNYEKAKAAYEQNQAAMVKVNRNLEYATITSPIDGVVINRAVEEGQTVAAGFETPTLFTIAADLTKMQVIADVDEADIGNVENGQRVSFTVDAYPNDVFEGTVMQIRLGDSESTSSSSSTSTSTVVTYEVVISADNPDLKLKPRLTANVTIFTLERDNVLTVPTKSLRFVPDAGMLTQLGYIVSEAGKEAPAGKRLVWIKNGQELKPKAVTVGSTSGNMIEITDGLNEGEELAVDLEASSITPAAEAETERSPFMPGPPGSNKNKKSAK